MDEEETHVITGQQDMDKGIGGKNIYVGEVEVEEVNA